MHCVTVNVTRYVKHIVKNKELMLKNVLTKDSYQLIYRQNVVAELSHSASHLFVNFVPISHNSLVWQPALFDVPTFQLKQV